MSATRVRRSVVFACACAIACVSCGGATATNSGGDAGTPPMVCASTPIAVNESGSIASGSAHDVCARLFSWGTGAPGSTCTRPLDCEPTCAACTTAGRSALTSWCNHNVCATPEETSCALVGIQTASCAP